MSTFQNSRTPPPRESIFVRLSSFLRALWVFFPGIIFMVLGLFLFTSLSQGKDIILQSTDGAQSWITGLYLVLAAIFWVFTAWYTARLIAYNRDDLFHRSPWVLYHFPRLIGYFNFLVLWLAVYLVNDHEDRWSLGTWSIIVGDIGIYVLFYHFVDRVLHGNRDPKRVERLRVWRWIVRFLLIGACLLVILRWQANDIQVLLYTLPVFQLGFLFLAIARRPLYDPSKGGTAPPPWLEDKIDQYMRWTFTPGFSSEELRFERPIFVVYHLLALACFICYLASINSIAFARELTSFPLVLLGFGILLGIVNIIALVSYRRKTNFNFLLLALIVIAGFVVETHGVRYLHTDRKETYAGRMHFRQYVAQWLEWHREELEDSTRPFPLFLVLADGGASRSGYWSASVLARLHEATRIAGTGRSYFLDHLFCLSGASGGSVGNTVFLSAYTLQQADPRLRTDSLCQRYLGNDFLVYPLARLLGPELILPLSGGSWYDRAAALEMGMDAPSKGDSSMGRFVGGSFSALMPRAGNRLPILSINTTRVNDGAPGVVSTIHIDSSHGIFGRRVDVLDQLPPNRDLRVSTAMVLGARFPYMSPGGRIGNSYYVDGGYFDNSGAGVAHEMLLELNRMASGPDTLLAKYAKRIHFYVIHLTNTPISSSAAEKPIHPVLNDLATPLLTLAGSYESQTSVNDARLINYLKEISGNRTSYIKVNLYEDRADSYPMNWVISQRARLAMDTRVHQKPVLDSIINRMNDTSGRSLSDLFHGFRIDN